MIEFTEIPSSQIMPVTGFTPIEKYSEIYSFLENYFYKLGYEYHRAFKTSAALSSKENNVGKLVVELLTVLEINLKENIKNKNSDALDPTLLLNENFAIMKRLIKILELNKIKLDENLVASSILGYLITKLK
jgi:hypothetical protein